MIIKALSYPEDSKQDRHTGTGEERGHRHWGGLGGGGLGPEEICRALQDAVSSQTVQVPKEPPLASGVRTYKQSFGRNSMGPASSVPLSLNLWGTNRVPPRRGHAVPPDSWSLKFTFLLL